MSHNRTKGLSLLGGDLPNTMSSVQIAQLISKEHHHLLRDIRKMEKSWVDQGQSKFGQSYYVNSQNRKMPMYELSKTECLYIATKFNDEARAKLIIRWEQLEKERVNPSDETIILQGYQLLAKKVEEQKLALEAQTEIVNYASEVLTSNNTFPISIIAEELGMSAIKLNRLLKQKGIQHRVGGEWIFYTRYKGLGYTKTHTITRQTSTGTRTIHCREWTEKGRQFIHNILASETNG